MEAAPVNTSSQENQEKIQSENNQEGNPQSALGSSLERSKTSSEVQNVSVDTLVKNKVIKLRQNYNFAICYSSGFLNIIKLFDTLLSERVGNTVVENKNVLKFFKDLSAFYLNFASQIQKSNAVFQTTSVPKIFDDGLKEMIEKTQSILSKNFNELSASLKNRIISKGPVAKIEELTNNLENYKKELIKKYEKIERRKKKLQKMYSSKYESLFEELCPIQNSVALKPSMFKRKYEETPDFIVIELEIQTSINKLFLKISLCLSETKDLVYKMNKNIVDFSKVVREALMIYIQENKKVFNTNITQNFSPVEQYYERMSKPGADQSFKMNKIFQTEELKQKMNSSLKDYQNLLKTAQGPKEDCLNYDNRFDIDYYENIELFFEQLITINPKPTPVSLEELLLGTFKIKRDPGVFKSWRDCVMMFSKQNHILVFDEPVSHNVITVFEKSLVTFRHKPDNKNPNLFEIVINKKGKIMNFSGTYCYDAKELKLLQGIGDQFFLKNPELKRQETA